MPSYRSRLADSLRRLASLKLDAGADADVDARGAVELFEGLPSRDGREQFWLACARATLAATAHHQGSGIPADEGPKLAERAIADLRKAVTMGYRSAPLFRYELDLEPLQHRPDFELLLLDLASPQNPFAP